MAKAARLNVYVTPAGFYDAVVAAPNQAAALRAWGAGSNLFGEKLAAVETDPQWRELALASPGQVLRKPRGDAAAILARPAPAARRAKGSHRPPPPPPDRSALDAAEAALRDARKAQERLVATWERRRRDLEAQAERELDAAAAEVAAAEAARTREAATFRKAST